MERKWHGIMLSLAITLGLVSGCSESGSLNVKNECSTEFIGHIDNQFVQLSPGQVYPLDVYIGKSAGIIGPKEYDILIDGSAWTKKPFAASITVKSNETTNYSIRNDAGAILFWNAYTLQVNSVNVRKCGDVDFGPNLVTTGRPFSPGDRLVIQLDPGCWDISINYGRLELKDTVDSNTVVVGGVDTIGWFPGYEPPAVK
jgi:hypothetical protein